MIDRFTKALLIVIALGLWVNALNPWVIPSTASAQTQIFSSMLSVLNRIASDVSDIQFDASSIENDLGRIQRGSCSNGTIC